MDLPDPEELLKDYKKYKKPKPDEHDKVHAIISSVTAAVFARKTITKKRWEAGMLVLAHAAQWTPDVCVSFTQSLLTHKPEGAELPLSAKKYVRDIVEQMDFL